MGGTSPRAGSYAIYLPCHSVQRGERLYCVARKLGCRPSAALIGAPPCSYPQRASAAPLGLAGSWSRVPPVAGLRRWCARWWLRAISSAACCPAVRAVRRRCSLSLLRAVVGGGLPVLANGSTLYFNRHLAPSANTGKDDACLQ